MLHKTGHGLKARIEHTDPALPVSVQVPRKLEAVEAMGQIQTMLRCKTDAILVDGEVVNAEQALDVLRRFILTR